MLRWVERFLRDHLILIIIATLVAVLGLVSLALASRQYGRENGSSLPAVEIKTPYEVEGVITAADLNSGTVSIRSKKTGQVITVTTDGNTMIEKNDAPATLSNLAVGDKVEVYYRQDNGSLATEIEAKSSHAPYEVEGIITAVDTGSRTLSIQSEKTGEVFTVVIDEKTVIEKNDAPATLSNLAVGDEAEVYYNGSLATKIEAKQLPKGDSSYEKERQVVPPPVSVRDDDWDDDDYTPATGPQRSPHEPSHVEKDPSHEEDENHPDYEDSDDYHKDDKARDEKEHQDKKDDDDRREHDEERNPDNDD